MKVKFRATITVEYESDSEAYLNIDDETCITDPLKMAALDAEAAMEEVLSWGEATMVIEPVT